MSDNQARVSVRILEKEYHITCPIEERSDLLDSAEFLNLKMREIRDSGKVVGLDRIAVIAALKERRRARMCLRRLAFIERRWRHPQMPFWTVAPDLSNRWG